jgi:tetratricopeptide (TPR) repeat protein
MRFSTSVLIACTVLASLGGLQTASAADDIEICMRQSGDLAIAACSHLIMSGRLKGKDLVAAYNDRGNAWHAKGDHDRAIADYSEAINLAAKDATGDYNRGYAWYARGDRDRAIADYNEAIKLDPRNATAYYNRGNAWYAKADYDRAITDYDEAIKLDPDAATYHNRGNAWDTKGEHDRAIADYSEAIKLDPKHASTYDDRGMAWLAKGDYDRAIADYSEAIALEPKNTRRYWNRGVADFAQGNFSAAAADMLNVNDRDHDAYAMLWRFLARGRIGQDGAGELSANAARLNSREWVYPVIDFYLGRRSLEEVRAAARSPGEKCEAAFYIGEWQLLRGDKVAARTELETASITCPQTFDEYAGAVAELKRLQP